MTIRTAVLAGLPWLLIASSTYASNPTGLSSAGALLEACEAVRSGQSTFDTGYCLGRVAGATWTLDAFATELKPRQECIPANVNADQLIRVFVKFASDNPNRLHEPDLRIVFDAMQQAWPCLKVPK